MNHNIKNPEYWSTRDGRRYISVPTRIPTGWTPAETKGRLVYVSGVYTIVRKPYGKSYTFTVCRDGIDLPLAFYSRLKDAKSRAVQNAQGRDVVNVA